MFGQRGPNTQLVKRPTLVVGNQERIMALFDNLRCTAGHIHDESFGSGQTRSLRVWPWQLAERLIEGVIQLT